MPSMIESVPTPTQDLSKKLPSLGKPRRRADKDAKLPNPPVHTPALSEPPSLYSIRYTHPIRRILSPVDHERFASSATHTLITAFAFTLADSIKDTSVSDIQRKQRHPTIGHLLSILDDTESILGQCPANENNGSRFGNPAFRNFLSFVSSQSRAWHKELLSQLTPEVQDGAADEISTYFVNAWGSSTRIDYGSGHELHFLVYLLCLNRVALLPPTSFQHVALLVFPRYLNIMRKLQATYYLEPAGSHGVWGLDDYHFLPFLFGAAQLHSHPFIRPLAIHNMAILDAYGDDYLYLDMVRYVNSTKTVQGLRWHSPMLDDISGVKQGWGKIYQGMRRMFLHEVIGKLVVMQHFLFGGLVPPPEGMADPENDRSSNGVSYVNEAHEGHSHNPNSWSDCCGIQVPSSIGASQEANKQNGRRLRPLPFD